MGNDKAQREVARIEALRKLQILDSAQEDAFEQIVRQAAQEFGTPIALVSLVDERRQWFKARVGLQAAQTPREYAFCQHAIESPRSVLLVEDASRDERFRSNPLVTADPNIRFYAGAPIVTQAGYALGTLCVIDRKPRTLTPSEQRRLQALAAQVVKLIEQRPNGLIGQPSIAQNHPDARCATAREVDPRSDVALFGRLPALIPLLRMVKEACGVSTIAVARLSWDRSSWTLCALDSENNASRIGAQIKAAGTLALTAVDRDEALIVDDLAANESYADRPLVRRHGLRAYAAVPIHVPRQGLFGVLCGFSTRPLPLSCATQRSLFEHLAQAIGTMIGGQDEADHSQEVLIDEMQLGELRERFMATLGHDLRSPIAAVAAGAAIIRKRAERDDLRLVAERINQAAKRMAVMVDDVLDFARSRMGGGIALRLAVHSDMAAAMQSVVDEFVDPAQGRAIRSHIDITQGVFCDRGRIQQVAANLLGNGITYGAVHGEVRFSAVIVDDHLQISVWNDGEPIAPDKMSTLFRAFSRRSGGQRHDGLGLGLFICEEIVRAHGGQLTASSSRDDGTTFTAQIPVKAMPDVDAMRNIGVI